MRYGKSILLIVAALMMMAGTAAAATLSAGNITLAAELIPASGTPLTLSGAKGVFVSYSGGALATNAQIKVSLTTGNTFSDANLYLCNGATAVAASVAAAGQNSVVFSIDAPGVTGPSSLTLQNAACDATPPAIGITIANGTLAGSQIVMAFDNNQVPGDSNIFASGVAVTVKQQFSAKLHTPITSVIDPLDFTRFSNSTTSTTSAVSFMTYSDETIQNKIDTGLLGNNTNCVQWAGKAGTAFYVTITPGTGNDFSALAPTQALMLTQVGSQTVQTTIGSSDATANGPYVMSTGPQYICGAGASPASNEMQILTFKVDGTTVLTPRTYSLAISTLGNGQNGDIVAAPVKILNDTTAWTWQFGSNVAVYKVQLIRANSPSIETYIKLQADSSIQPVGGNNFQVVVSILADDGSLMATYLPGAITPGTPMLITGSQLVAAATAAGKTVNGNAGFAGMITILAPLQSTYVYANILEAGASGSKRVPVIPLVYNFKN
jgi:hypothetical protein